MRLTINTLVIALGALAVAACGGAGDGAIKTGVSNDLLIIGYDREPDTMPAAPRKVILAPVWEALCCAAMMGSPRNDQTVDGSGRWWGRTLADVVR